MSIESQGHFLPYIFQVLYVLCFSRPRYQVSVYRTIDPLVYYFCLMFGMFLKACDYYPFVPLLFLDPAADASERFAHFRVN